MEPENVVPALAERSVTALAAVAVRTFELVDEFRWRYDVVTLAFHERITPLVPAHLQSLQLLGRDEDGTLLWCATADTWHAGRFIPARIDAGSPLIEAPSFTALGAILERRPGTDQAVLRQLYESLSR